MISAELCYRDYTDTEDFQNTFVNLNFFGDSRAKNLLKELIDLVKIKETILREVKITCLTSQIETNIQKIKYAQEEYRRAKDKYRALETQSDIYDTCRRIRRLQRHLKNTGDVVISEPSHQEESRLLAEFQSKVGKLTQQNNINIEKIDRLKSSQLYSVHKLKEEYIELISDLGFNLAKTKNRDINNIDEQVYEYYGSNEDMIKLVSEKIEEYRKSIQIQVEQIERVYTDKNRRCESSRRVENNNALFGV